MDTAGEGRFRVKQASVILGIPASTLRTWERRYGVAAPERSDGGQRLYRDADIAVLAAMRDLVHEGMPPAIAAEVAERHRSQRQAAAGPTRADGVGSTALPPTQHHGGALVAAAARWDVAAATRWIDEGFALGPFEEVVDSWLMPSLVTLGNAERDRVIATSACQTISHAVLRRLAVTYDQAGTGWRRQRIVVGLPGGAHHELGALAFAAVMRRRGFQTLYLGPDVPLEGWTAGVSGWKADAAVLGVPRYDDRANARVTAGALRRNPSLLVAAGGGAAAALLEGVSVIGPAIRDAAEQLDHRLTVGPA